MIKTLFLLIFATSFLGCFPRFNNPPPSTITDMSDIDLHRSVNRMQIMHSAETRRRPVVPHIAASLSEARNICNRQGADLHYNQDATAAACILFDIPIFKLSLEEDIVISIEAFYEDAEIFNVSEIISRKLGSPTIFNDNNHLTHQWLDGNFMIEITNYPLGVRYRLSFIGNKDFPPSWTGKERSKDFDKEF